MATVDVTVMGAGIFGLSIAWACVGRGALVRVIDPNGPGGGASGGVVGALAPHTPERWEPKKEFQLESLLAAGRFWQDVDAESKISSGYGRTGRLQPILDDHGMVLAREREIAARTLWRGLADWKVVPLSDHQDWAPPSSTGWLVYDSLAARIDPFRACQSLATAVQKRGGSLAQDGDQTGKVVWATGVSGLEYLTRQVGRETGNGVKGQAALLALDAGHAPQLFSHGIHVIPHDNGTVGVGSTSERYYDDPTATDAQLDDLLAKARVIFPQLADAPIVKTWAGIRPRARTRAPMLGEYPQGSGHFIANGGFKIGFGMAPKIAEIMADLILDGRDRIPDAFRVQANL